MCVNTFRLRNEELLCIIKRVSVSDVTYSKQLLASTRGVLERGLQFALKRGLERRYRDVRFRSWTFAEYSDCKRFRYLS